MILFTRGQVNCAGQDTKHFVFKDLIVTIYLLYPVKRQAYDSTVIQTVDVDVEKYGNIATQIKEFFTRH